jgi:hypothetical protein
MSLTIAGSKDCSALFVGAHTVKVLEACNMLSNPVFDIYALKVLRSAFEEIACRRS